MYLIHQLLEQNAERFSERDAIVYQDQCISYQALADSAKRLAHALLAHGVKPGNRVTIYLDKGIEAVISLLAMHHGQVPPTINLQQPSAECVLDYVPKTARERPPKPSLG